jgi:hypothetical protein
MPEHGGYRRPSRPAAVSGPGKFSRRTDGAQPKRIASGGDYGERSEMESIQSGAAMGATPSAAQAASGAAPMPIDPSGLTPLDAPTARPEEPVVAGMDQFTATPPSQLDDQTRERLRSHLPTLLWLASRPQASEQTRQFVRQIRADL